MVSRRGRNVPSKPSATPYVNPKAAGAPGKLKAAGGSAKAYTPNRTGTLPSGAAFPGKGPTAAMEDLWAGRKPR